MHRPLSGKQTRVPSQSSSVTHASTQARSTQRRPVKQSSSLTHWAASRQIPSAQVCAPGQSLFPPHSATAISGGRTTSGGRGAASAAGVTTSAATSPSDITATSMFAVASVAIPPSVIGPMGMGVGLLSPHATKRPARSATALQRAKVEPIFGALPICPCNIKHSPQSAHAYYVARSS